MTPPPEGGEARPLGAVLQVSAHTRTIRDKFHAMRQCTKLLLRHDAAAARTVPDPAEGVSLFRLTRFRRKRMI